MNNICGNKRKRGITAQAAFIHPAGKVNYNLCMTNTTEYNYASAKKDAKIVCLVIGTNLSTTTQTRNYKST